MHTRRLSTGREVLEGLNYIVITASNGADALQIYETRMNDIALLILDVVMPEMGGSNPCNCSAASTLK